MNRQMFLDSARELALSNPSNSTPAIELRTAAKGNPKTFEEYLKTIAQQTYTAGVEQTAVEMYGQELVDIAKTLFPPQIHETKIKGGKADNLTLDDIAKKFNVSIQSLRKELAMGEKVEMEHTKSKSLAKDIAMDHLSEMPDYYTRLNKMEDKALKHWGKKEIQESLRKALIAYQRIHG